VNPGCELGKLGPAARLQVPLLGVERGGAKFFAGRAATLFVESFVAEWRGRWFCVVSDGKVRAVSMFEGSREDAVSVAESNAGVEVGEVFREVVLVDEVLSYLEEGKPLSSRAEPRGTEFQEAVWEAATGVRLGEMVTYGEIASRVGRPGAARAVGGALGANPAPLFVPCHRVVSSDGLGGFSGGVEVKRFLLGLEGVEV